MAQNHIEDLTVEEIPTQTADSLLESLSLPTMESSIREQIEGEINTSRDFLETVLEKFRAIDEHAEDDVKRGIRSEMVDWAYQLILAIVHHYNIGYDGSDEDSMTALDTLEVLYQFFVLDKHQNTLDFFNRYIEVHKKSITETMGIVGRGVDVTAIANRKKGYSKHDVAILSNMDEVIRFIADADISTSEFLSLIDTGDYAIAAIKSKFDDGTLIGEIFSEYISSEIGTYAEDISIGLRSSIREYLANV